MPIEGFDFKEFARNLAEQVGPALPPDIADADKQYIVNIVHNFCYMAGEAISNDTTINFNAEQASIVSQFIGEWAFHKAIDSIRGNIPPQLRDGILQKVAFTVFESFLFAISCPVLVVVVSTMFASGKASLVLFISVSTAFTSPTETA